MALHKKFIPGPGSPDFVPSTDPVPQPEPNLAAPFQDVASRFGGSFDDGAFTSDRTAGEFTGEGSQEFASPISLMPGETADQFFQRILTIGGVSPDRLQTDRPTDDAVVKPDPIPESTVTLKGTADSFDPNTAGGISSLFSSPQIQRSEAVNAPEDDRLTQLLGKFSAGIVSPEDRRIQESQLISQIQEGSARRREQLAEKQGAAGIVGGAARSELNRVFGESERGLATGLAGIQSNILNKNLEGKTAALEQLFGLQGLSSQEARAQAELATRTNISQGGLDRDTNRLRLDEIKTSLSNQISQGRLDLDTAALDFNVALQQETNAIRREEMIQEFTRFLLEQMRFADEATQQRLMEFIRSLGV